MHLFRCPRVIEPAQRQVREELSMAWLVHKVGQGRIRPVPALALFIVDLGVTEGQRSISPEHGHYSGLQAGRRRHEHLHCLGPTSGKCMCQAKVELDQTAAVRNGAVQASNFILKHRNAVDPLPAPIWAIAFPLRA
ncbi:hypothetical protein AS189_19105 (plasmid) [Arthrobacter alpinus]|uniref:Uncharacterized protein n=1 Tax=Arthrobacter alpinus TaxID=656366 RepID=A0A0S2M4W7_9MICC|nr:hypothetical protein AS189_19105 [Arthrobacter alpinus]